MKVLFYRYGSICEPDLIAEFKKIGLEVDTVNDEIENKSLSPTERIDLVSKYLSKENYAFIFGINFFPSISDLCQIYRLPYVCWIVDAPLLELFSTSIKNACNRIFCFDRRQYERICNYNPDCIFHLPLATNVSRWDEEIKAISQSDIKKFSADISFIGSLYIEKDPFLEAKKLSDYTKGFIDALIASQSLIHGSGIIESALNDTVINELKKAIPASFYDSSLLVTNTDSFIAAHHILGFHCSSLERIDILKRLSDHFKVDLYTASSVNCFKEYPNISIRGTAKTLTEMPRIFNLSKINLNMTIHPIESGASLRIWDILGCGGFLISNYQEELFEYLEPRVDFDYYTSVDELIDKCQYYLDHDDIRSKIAINGYNKVKTYHTYTNRMPTIISSIMR